MASVTGSSFSGVLSIKKSKRIFASSFNANRSILSFSIFKNRCRLRKSTGGLCHAVGPLRRTEGRLRKSTGGLCHAVGPLRRTEGRLRKSTGGLCHAVGPLRRTEGRLRKSTGGLCHAVGPLRRTEGGGTRIRT